MPEIDITYGRSRTLLDALSDAEILRYVADQIARVASVYTAGDEVTDAIQALRDWADKTITHEQANTICKTAANVYKGVELKNVDMPKMFVTIAAHKLTAHHGEVSMALRAEASMRAACRATVKWPGGSNADFDDERELQITALGAV